MTYYPEFAKLLNKYLDAEDRSATWLAQRLGFAPNTVSRWRTRDTRPGTPETVIRIADILGIYNPSERLALLKSAGYDWLRDEEPFAMIIHVNQEVQVVRAITKQKQTARFGMHLERGDRVITLQKGLINIVCKNGVVIRLSEGRELTVDCRQDAPESVQLASIFTNSLPQTFTLHVTVVPSSFDSSVMQNLGKRTRARNVPILLTPRNTFITDRRPTFRWQPLERAWGYRIRVVMPRGYWWERETEQSYLPYPYDEPVLESDNDPILVTVVSLDDPDTDDEPWLRIIDEKKLAELEQAKVDLEALPIEDVAKSYLLAQLYRQFELHSAAIEELERLIETQEDISANLWQQLGELYSEITLYAQANQHYQAVLDDTSATIEQRVQAYIGLARVAYAFGERQEALEQLTTAERLCREVEHVELANLIAVERSKLGRSP